MPHLVPAELNFDAVLFDFANTLVPTSHVGPAVFAEVVTAAGHDPDLAMDDFDRSWSRAEAQLTLRGVMARAVDPAQSAELTTKFWKTFTTRSLTTAEVPGASAFLAQLNRENLKAAMVSQVRKRDLDAQLSVRGWKQYFSSVFTLEDFVVPKPHPHAYRVSLERMGVNSDRAIAFEHSSAGLKAAAAANIATVHMGCEGNLCQEDADFHARDFIDIEIDVLSAIA